MSVETIFAAIVAYGGFFLGIALSFIAPEEIESYKRYMQLLYAVCIASLGVFVTLSLDVQLTFIQIPIMVILFASLLITIYKMKSMYLSFVHLVPIIIIYFLADNQEDFVFVLLLVFIAGLALGSIKMSAYIKDCVILAKRHDVKRIIFPEATFIILLLPLLF